MAKLFEGIRVIDFTNNAAGPVCASILADYGAEVIHLERPVVGDDGRMFGPYVDGKGAMFLWLNRGKKSITVDLQDPEGRKIAHDLIMTADVVIENFRPGVMKKFGLDYATLKEEKPSLVYCSISAYGQTGPYSQKPGYDLIAQAMSGVMDLTGEPDGAPVRSGVVLADYNAGFNGYAGIAMALYYREKTGIGQHVDVSLVDCLLAMNSTIENAELGGITHRTGNHQHALAPFGLFKGRDGYAVICAPNNKLWGLLAGVMGKPELAKDPKFVNAKARIENLKELVATIEGWLQSFEHVEEPIELMDQGGVPACKVYKTEDIIKDEHLRARGMITQMRTPADMPSIDTVTARGVHLKFSETPGELGVAPMLGEHNYEIFQELGYDKEAVDAILSRWAEKVKK